MKKNTFINYSNTKRWRYMSIDNESDQCSTSIKGLWQTVTHQGSAKMQSCSAYSYLRGPYSSLRYTSTPTSNSSLWFNFVSHDSTVPRTEPMALVSAHPTLHPHINCSQYYCQPIHPAECCGQNCREKEASVMATVDWDFLYSRSNSIFPFYLKLYAKLVICYEGPMKGPGFWHSGRVEVNFNG